MYSRIRLIIAVAVALVLCWAAADQGGAKVIRDGKTGPFNPAVEAGGHPLAANANDIRPPVGIPYSLMGEMGTEYPWFTPCVVWRGRMLSPFHRHHHGAVGRTTTARLGCGPINWLP